MVLLVLFSVSLVVPRFELTDTMRPWSKALKSLVSDNRSCTCINLSALGRIRAPVLPSGKVVAINSPDQMVELTDDGKEVFCIADNKTLDEVAHIAKVEMKIHAVTRQSDSISCLALEVESPA